jgi:hypothetical protein
MRLVHTCSRGITFSTILQSLIVHLVLGYRQLSESEFYREDPLVKRVLSLKSLPSVPTVSRMLSELACEGTP